MTGFLGKIAALAAAYAVALNLILPVPVGLLTRPMAGDPGGSALCSAADLAPAKGPERPRPPCPAGPACALAACEVGALRAGDEAVPGAPGLDVLPLSPRPEGSHAASFDAGRGHPARGPPTA
jgi:hypothetical protein